MQAAAIMARMPVPGQVKTRLVPPLTPFAAARLYAGFLQDSIDRLARIDGIRPFVAYTPSGAGEFFSGIVPPEFSTVPQTNGDLGERLAAVSETLFSRGATAAVLCDSDSPTLPGRYIREAFQRLDEADVVIGPCNDGGYYLIGMRRHIPRLFAGIPWSSARVTQRTIEAAERLDLGVSLLEPWHDVDTGADLDRLCHEVRAAAPGDETFARHTRRALAELGLLM
ncbi:glycosyltransferase [Methanoculleus sp. YWC-01]|jgi:rSAM/selenodomain-associated transferase 1|uniref:Glycosyltransferase n=1 Tax=Methanoculleus nereidis TaxID=2735141 RepID=A0ABU3Z4B8_9EURY|nr:TIGR04282 family arsenosugar biosynthesis glycosyltransferase [Methanoculleus sp. YWC-01]MDV4343657.1 glycosyltransferase [Methanoculleus sp. YWC-01]